MFYVDKYITRFLSYRKYSRGGGSDPTERGSRVNIDATPWLCRTYQRRHGNYSNYHGFMRRHWPFEV